MVEHTVSGTGIPQASGLVMDAYMWNSLPFSKLGARSRGKKSEATRSSTVRKKIQDGHVVTAVDFSSLSR